MPQLTLPLFDDDSPAPAPLPAPSKALPEWILALTVWQPWASLIAYGLKEYETRHWRFPPGAKGKLVAIHSAKRWTASEQRAARHLEQFYRHLQPPIQDYPLGAIVAIVRMVECVPSELLLRRLSPLEKACGDYSPNRFGWRMELVQRLTTPVPAAGQQGFWMWSTKGLLDANQ